MSMDVPSLRGIDYFRVQPLGFQDLAEPLDILFL